MSAETGSAKKILMTKVLTKKSLIVSKFSGPLKKITLTALQEQLISFYSSKAYGHMILGLFPMRQLQ